MTAAVFTQAGTTITKSLLNITFNISKVKKADNYVRRTHFQTAPMISYYCYTKEKSSVTLLTLHYSILKNISNIENAIP